MLEMLPAARDIAIIALAIEGIVVLVLPLVLLWQGARALRRGRPRIAELLFQANQQVARTTRAINGVLLAVRRPFLWFASTYATLESALKRAARFVGSGR